MSAPYLHRADESDFEAILTDADLMLSWLNRLTADDGAEAIGRATVYARLVYEGIPVRAQRLSLSTEQESILQDRLDRLRARLRFWERSGTLQR